MNRTLGGGPVVALTMGDPAGIGPEITLKAWAALRSSGAPFLIYANLATLSAAAMAGGLPPPRAITAPDQAVAVFAHALPVIDAPLAHQARPGAPDRANSQSVVQSIQDAVAAALSGAVSAVVTNPVSKAVLYEAGFGFPGHTELIAALCATAPGQSPADPVMMLCAPARADRPGLRAALVTIHAPLKAAIESLTCARIVQTADVTHAALKHDFAIAAPRLALAGLNPHAGEAGALGREEIDIITPAAERLRARGVEIAGPLSPDTMFHDEARDAYDAAICLYHDQGLIAVKTLDFHRGVNVTLGLPIVRTSPDHGTAFDITGTGAARADSLIEAIRLAGELAANRARPGVET